MKAVKNQNENKKSEIAAKSQNENCTKNKKKEWIKKMKNKTNKNIIILSMRSKLCQM